MLAAVPIAAWCQSALPLAITAAGSFGHWLWQERARFRQASFGAANWVTTLRLGCVIALAWLLDQHLPLPAAALAFAIFSLDGLDGYLARRANMASELGALYDSEVDASFTLLLTWGVLELGRAGPWVLLGGLLRYAYVLAMHHSRASETKAPRTRLARYVFALSVCGYTLSLWPLQVLGPLLPALATGLLGYSFGVSFYGLWANARSTH
jgi:phosphatidylglycerophosphate synthase